MTAKRIVVWSVVAILTAQFLASPIPRILLFVGYFGIFEPMVPSTISWDAKNAYLKCSGAIADPRIWPPTPYAACEAMYLCTNEARLSDAQMKELYAQIRKTPGCQEP